MKRLGIWCCLPAAFICLTGIQAQTLGTDVREQIGKLLDAEARKEVATGRIRIDSVAAEGKELRLFANTNCADIPFRTENVADIYQGIGALLPAEWRGYKVRLFTNSRPIEQLIPMALQGGKDKNGKKDKRKRKGGGETVFAPEGGKPLVSRLSQPYEPTHGLQGRHIALWQSHGFYYEGKLNRWEWQRARIFQTVEDLYTQGYVLPFLVPMLENAGANVLLPRERDWQTREVIVDNDGTSESTYTEYTGIHRWRQGEGTGFAHLRQSYTHGQNPFTDGTYRQVQTLKKGKESTAEWLPAIPARGRYAVYVSYRTVEGSTDDAHYSVHHAGGVTHFSVNQQMGGGTWIYLGTFEFEAGQGNAAKVVLSNRSAHADRIVTADGVKIGGGMGNMARYIAPANTSANVKSSEAPLAASAMTDAQPTECGTAMTSGYPRFCEGARYWMQWAGVPDSIYSYSNNTNDYTDDYRGRGTWVNYLAGGSQANPHEKGLNIPIDLAFAFHTDAGTTLNDSIIGTLGIYTTNAYNGQFANGASRYLSRDLTDLIMSHITHDVRTLYEPEWTRRGMWNKNYAESRLPQVPTMLLELLSHQNFADMRYGLDPRFRFTVSRAICKGILQFVSSQRGTPYIVQPLPVNGMSLQQVGEHEVELSWQPAEDPLEPTARATRYIVYTRVGKGAFDNGTLVEGNHFRTTLPAGVVCSFKVTAVNAGGESFPSEILSAGRAFNAKGEVLVVNGFDRISAPADFVAPGEAGKELAGFVDQLDHGVPYLHDISYIGPMKEYRRAIPWMDDDASGFGDSYATHETEVIAGNSFDYPALHGEALLRAGYSFSSCSDEAVENGVVTLGGYHAVDYILGKECQTKMGRGGVKPLAFKTFSTAMQQALTRYCEGGGNLLVSGAYVGTDLWDSHYATADKQDQHFATEVLKYQWRAGQAACTGAVHSVHSPLNACEGKLTYHHTLNGESYVVESPDAIVPATPEAHTVMRYSENNLSAAVAYRGNYRTFVMGFPFEAIRTPAEREKLMRQIMQFFEQ